MSAKILLVEDDTLLIQSIKHLLELDGHVVTTATNGVEGLEVFSKGQFNVVVTDIKMPKMNGLDMMKTMKTIDPSVEVIVLTGFGTMEMAIEVIRHGGYDFLRKPDDVPHRIRTTVQHAIDKRQMAMKNLDLLQVLEEQIVDISEEARRLAAQHEITTILAESSSLSEAIPRVLTRFITNFGWTYGAMWKFDPHDEVLRCLNTQYKTDNDTYIDIMEKRQEDEFQTGIGLPGNVWENKTFMSSQDGEQIVATEADGSSIIFKGIGFPIMLGDTVFGILEFFHSHMSVPDEKMIRMMTDISHHLGLFIEREQFEHQFIQSQKMEAIGRLASGIAHDFNNILTTMIGHAHLIERKYDDPEDLCKKAKIIQQTGYRATGLIQQLMAFSKDQVLEPALQNINENITNLGPMMKRLLTENIELNVNLGQIDPVIVDQTQLDQVILNLAVNARDAMSEGGCLNIETSSVYMDDYEARIHGLSKGRYVCLDVRDSGHGMDDTVKAHIFEPFYTTKPQGKGTGLGLATVYGIVTQSNGMIDVISEPGQGTTFSIYLPAEQAAVEPDIEYKEIETVEVTNLKGAETVLVVEDEYDVRDMIRQILEQSGYKVIEACHGKAALEIVENHTDPIDLVVTDLIMPEMNGSIFAQKLLARQSDMKIIFISGYSADVLSECNISEADIPLLMKPFSPGDLLRQIRSRLDGVEYKAENVKTILDTIQR